LTSFYRGVLFTLYVENESGDKWCEYYKDGMYEEVDAIITYPEFNEACATPLPKVWQ
jgi:hypothetical protein